ncbi:MAG: hypothetical protein E7172_02475 [Firmicutes bacterium]|nr:hypothetical protein [Bacillota bacterium]
MKKGKREKQRTKKIAKKLNSLKIVLKKIDYKINIMKKRLNSWKKIVVFSVLINILNGAYIEVDDIDLESKKILEEEPIQTEIIDNTKSTSDFDYSSMPEYKKEFILEKYNLTEEEFQILKAIVLAEAKANSYEDAYAVINTIYNRTQSKRWISFVENVLKETDGTSLYYQAICPSQFVVYENGRYKKFLEDETSVGYEAIIDFLTTNEPMHNYLSFYASFGSKEGRVQYVTGGNLYYNELPDWDIYEPEVTLIRTKNR